MRITPLVAMTFAAIACVPLSDLDSAASGDPSGNETGGGPLATGGQAGGTITTGGSGASAQSGGAPLVGGTGGVAASGGTGGVATSGGAGGHVLDGGSSGVEINGGSSGVETNGGSSGVEINGGSSGAEPSGGTGGVEPVGGNGGNAGNAGNAGGTGGTLCVGDLQNCDTNPDDCETDITSDPEHCGACNATCPGTYDVCIEKQCVEPCIWETAFEMVATNTDYRVPGNGCVKITQHLAGSYQLLADRETPFHYEAEECGFSGDGTMPENTGSAAIPACPMVIDLLGTSPDVVLRWWNTGG